MFTPPCSRVMCPHVLVVQVISEAGAGAGAGGEWVNYLVSLQLLSTHGTTGHWSLAPGHPVIQSYGHHVLWTIWTSCHTTIVIDLGCLHNNFMQIIILGFPLSYNPTYLGWNSLSLHAMDWRPLQQLQSNKA